MRGTYALLIEVKKEERILKGGKENEFFRLNNFSYLTWVDNVINCIKVP